MHSFRNNKIEFIPLSVRKGFKQTAGNTGNRKNRMTEQEKKKEFAQLIICWFSQDFVDLVTVEIE